MKRCLMSAALVTLLGLCVLGLTNRDRITEEINFGRQQRSVAQAITAASPDQVRGFLGTPDTTSTVAPATFYYISSTVKGAAFLEPTEVDRHILAVYFTQFGTVDQLANYTLKDGKLIDVIGRTTPTARGDKSLVEKLFKGIGKKQQLFDPEKPQ